MLTQEKKETISFSFYLYYNLNNKKRGRDFMKDNRKTLYYFVALSLFLSVIGISVGFAAMSTELRVNGTTTVAPANWKIKFLNLSSPTIVGDASVETAPQIQSDTHIGNYEVKLTKPGDTITYTFDITNDGTLDAELSSYTFTNPTITGTGATALKDAEIVKKNLVYTLTYMDGSSINNNDELKKGETKTLKLVIGYDSAANELPTNSVSVGDMDITFVYSQK